MRKISVSSMDGILVGRREWIHSVVLVSEYVDSCAPPQKLLAVIVQDSHSQSWLAVVKPHNPLVDTDAYVASSDVSLAGYICTHVCLFYVLQRDVRLLGR